MLNLTPRDETSLRHASELLTVQLTDRGRHDLKLFLLGYQFPNIFETSYALLFGLSLNLGRDTAPSLGRR